MATSTLVQYLESNLVTGLGASVGVSKETSDRSQVETFIAKETLLVGDWVAFDYAATNAGDVTLGVYKADGNSAPVRTPFGVVIGAAATNGLLTAGNKIKVCISGVCNAFVGDNAGGGHAATGVLLQITNTAGAADIAAAGSTQPICGILSEIVPAGAGVTLKRVVVIKQF
jgi:hypothetical protein